MSPRRPPLLLASTLFVLLAVPAAPAAPAAPVSLARGPDAAAGPSISVAYDLVAAFEDAEVRNSSASSAALDQRSGNVPRPGIFLHPQGRDPSGVLYRSVRVPPGGDGTRPFLLFRPAIRDGVPWEGRDGRRPNGVRFSVAIDGRVAYREVVAGPGWRSRAIDLAPWAGRSISIELRTEAIDGDTNWDWSVFGEPLVVTVRGVRRRGDLTPRAAGLALARVRRTGPGSLTVGLGGRSESVPARDATAGRDADVQWIPIDFDGPDGGASVTVRSDGGDERPEVAKAAAVTEVLWAPWPAELVVTGIELASPLLTVGQPVDLLVSVRNTGRGRLPAGRQLAVEGHVIPLFADSRIDPIAGQVPVGELAPGASRILRWEGPSVAFPALGELSVAASSRLALRVVRSEPPASRLERGGTEPGARLDDGLSVVAGSVTAAGARLLVLTSIDGVPWVIAQTRAGDRWVRVGTIYPLARLVLEGDEGHEGDGGTGGEGAGRREVELLGTRLEVDGRSLRLAARSRPGAPGEPEWAATVTITASADAPRFDVVSRLEAPSPLRLRAFSGPVVLAGDRSFGARKDFALFGGLEYLEGDEPSSSDRDLAWPLSDRRVPKIWKLASPVMAVQARDALVALLWDPRQAWSSDAGRDDSPRHPAARFLAPRPGEGPDHLHLSLIAPSVAGGLGENRAEAEQAVEARSLRLASTLVLDHASRYPRGSIVHGPHRGGLLLQAYRHLFDLQGVPEPSPLPRTWDEERALCREAYHRTVWHDDPPGWSHCHGWKSEALVGHSVPLLLDLRAGVPGDLARETRRRIDAVLRRLTAERGPNSLWTNAGCHIVLGELPFLHGRLAESLEVWKRAAWARLRSRRDGLWRWYPASQRHSTLGTPGGHTLGQAAQPSWYALRAARLSGDRELTRAALDAARQLERYEVPRGAQMWECPLEQPDILAAAYAIRAHAEAYRLTGDPRHLDRARYWAWTGLPFLYLWSLEGYPTMRYNVISVIGSTFHTHSWIGRPVVWCGLVYAYALLDLAEVQGLDTRHDPDALPWRTISRGILRSAMWQQYTSGPSRGCYPDSWEMPENRPNPADIGPENLLMIGFRLRGISPEPRSRRLRGADGSTVMVSSAADIETCEATGDLGTLRLGLSGPRGVPAGTIIAPVPEPGRVDGCGERAASSEALDRAPSGWLYHPPLRAVILRTSGRGESTRVDIEIHW